MSTDPTAHLDSGDGVISILNMDKPFYIIGRFGGDADIQIRDRSMSRHHAKISWNGANWVVEDLVSKNQTFINKVPLKPKIAEQISNGDQLHFGAAGVIFRIGELPKDEIETLDSTVAVNLSDIPFDQMFHKAGLKSDKPESIAENPTVTSASNLSRDRTIPISGLPSEDSRGGLGSNDMILQEKSLGFLELRSISNPIRYYITKEKIIIGSNPKEGCDIILAESGIEARHAEIRFIGGRNVRLKNLSSGGTSLNGKRVSNTKISHGDIIDFGDTSFTFNVIRFPTSVTVSGKSGSGSRFAILILVVGILGMVGYYYYFDDLFPQGLDGGNTGPTQDSRPSVSQLLVVEDYIRNMDYNNAAIAASALSRESDDRDEIRNAEQLLHDIRKLTAARDHLGSGNFLHTIDQLNQIHSNGRLKVLAHNEIDRVMSSAERLLNNKLRALAEDERLERWDDAIVKLRNLEGSPINFGIDVSRTIRRIELKKRMSNEYQDHLRNIQQNHRLVRDRTETLLREVTEAINIDQTLSQDLSSQKEKIEFLNRHAVLLERYFAYRGESLDNIRIITTSIRPDYDLYQDISRIDRNLTRLYQIESEKVRLLRELSEDSEQMTRETWIKIVDQLIDNRKNLLRVEGSSESTLAQRARRDIEQFEETKRSAIVEIWNRYTFDGVLDHLPLRQRVSNYQEMRHNTYEILLLFPREIREKIRSDRDIDQYINDRALGDVYRKALQHYNLSLREVRTAFERANLERQPEQMELLRSAPRIWQEFRRYTLPEDSLSITSIDETLRRLGGR